MLFQLFLRILKSKVVKQSLLLEKSSKWQRYCRRVFYWTEKFISFIREHRDAHTAIHLDTISKIVGSGFYDKDGTPTLGEILGREPQDFYESLKKNPKIMSFASSK